MTHSFEHGDHVYVGPAKKGKVHWMFWCLAHEAGMALLKSPMSGRLRREPIANLTPYAKEVPA